MTEWKVEDLFQPDVCSRAVQPSKKRMSPEYLPNEDWWKSIKAALNLLPPLLNKSLRACKRTAKDSYFDHRHMEWGRVVCDLENSRLVATREFMVFMEQRFREELNYNSSVGTKTEHQKHNLNSDPGLTFRKASNTSEICWTGCSFQVTKSTCQLCRGKLLQLHEHKGSVGWNGTISVYDNAQRFGGRGRQTSKQKTEENWE